MCELCDENDGGPTGCQSCGRLICWDITDAGDNVMQPAFVTSSGDLYCSKCGAEIEAHERQYEQGEYGAPLC